MNVRNWVLKPYDRNRAEELAQAYSLSQTLADLMTVRGIDTPELVEEFLGEGSGFSDPFLLTDMDKAVERINRAADNMERIAVYGDYDADGVTATAMLYSYLETRGADVCYYIPQRLDEGYGMNIAAVEKLAADGVDLIITVDNGIASVKEVARAKELGVDVVITDHHRPQGELPGAVAVVDAHRQGDQSPFKDFSGVGIVFKLLMALESEVSDTEDLLEAYSDLVTIGTIGDVVDLTGENRLLCKAGLRLLTQSDRAGIQALLQAAGVADRVLTAVTVAFSLVPRINATGRMGSAENAVQLLTSVDEEEAEGLAAAVCAENERRRVVEADIAAEAFAAIESEGLSRDRVIVVAGDDWHHGVIGIVASRIVERYGKPCIVLSRSAEETKGSGRSVEGFSLFEAICSAEHLLLRYGGHPMAAGVTLKTENIAAFRAALNTYARENHPRMPALTTTLDLELDPAKLSYSIADEAARLEPFGTGNPQPVFGLFGMTLQDITPVGKESNHLRLMLEKNGSITRVMYFYITPEEFPYRRGDRLDLAVELENRPYKGAPSLSVIVRDVRPAGMDTGAQIASLRDYEDFVRGEKLAPQTAAGLLPDRAALADIYRAVRAENGKEVSFLRLSAALGGMPLGKLLTALAAFEERGLLTLTVNDDRFTANIIEQSGKIDINASPVLTALR